MWRKTLRPAAVIIALALAPAAGAQETSAPASRGPAYSESRMQDFARATVELQALPSQDPDSMTRAIEGAGMSVEDYNSMGDAMRADPALAASLYPYLDTANLERTARVTRLATQGLDRSPPKRQAVAAKTSRRSHAKARSHKRKAAASRQHATKRKGHAAASKQAARHRQRKG